MPIVRLHFVYNVEATPKALVKDFIHRLIEPETYPCRLCDITYGRFVKKPGLILFLRSLPVPSRFYTKDRFLRRYPKIREAFPAVLAENERGKLSVFLAAAELSQLQTLPQLKSEVSARLSAAAGSRNRDQAPMALPY